MPASSRACTSASCCCRVAARHKRRMRPASVAAHARARATAEIAARRTKQCRRVAQLRSSRRGVACQRRFSPLGHASHHRRMLRAALRTPLLRPAARQQACRGARRGAGNSAGTLLWPAAHHFALHGADGVRCRRKRALREAHQQQAQQRDSGAQSAARHARERSAGGLPGAPRLRVRQFRSAPAPCACAQRSGVGAGKLARLLRGAMQALRCGPPVAASTKRRGAANGGARAAQRGPEPAPEAARRAVVLAPPLALLAAALSPAGAAHAGASAASLAGARSNGNSATNNGFEYMPALNDKDYGKVRCSFGAQPPARVRRSAFGLVSLSCR